MKNIRDTPLAVAIDFETTGIVPGHPDEPWQIGMVKVSHGKVVETEYFESLFKIGDRPFNYKAPGNHHRIRNQLKQAPEFVHQLMEIMPWLLGHPLIAHNISVEKKIINHALPIHQSGPWIDTLTLSRIAYPDLKSHTLSDLLDLLQLTEKIRTACPGRAPHDALYDAVGCAFLFEHLIHLAGWEQVSVEHLSNAHPEHFFAERNQRTSRRPRQNYRD